MNSDREEDYDESLSGSQSPARSSFSEINDNVSGKATSGNSRLPVYARQSVNVITAPSNTGKTTLLKQIMAHRDVFFERGGAEGLVYVNCNARNAVIALENPFEDVDLHLEVTVLAMHDVEDPVSLLKPGHVVVLDDVVSINSMVEHFVTYAAHHNDVTLFLVTQGLLANKLFRLVHKIHTLTLFFGNSSTPPLARHLLTHFFLDADTKNYLKKVFAQCEKHKLTCVLKLNDVASSSQAYKKVLLFANIEQLFKAPQDYCVIYPELNQDKQLQKLMELGEEADDETWVLVKAKHVKAEGRKESATSEDVQEKETGAEIAPSAEKSKWGEMFDTVVQEIRNVFPVGKWSSCINIFKEILRVDQFRLGSKADGYKSLLLKGKRKLRVSLIDFLQVLTRRGSHFEPEDKFRPFFPFLKQLLRNHIPLTFIKNQRLLDLSSGKTAKKKKQRPTEAPPQWSPRDEHLWQRRTAAKFPGPKKRGPRSWHGEASHNYNDDGDSE